MANQSCLSVDSAQANELFTHARHASAFLKALSHETRLLKLCILAEGEKTVGELEAVLNLPQAIVSQQLARLRADHIVTTRRKGRLVYYSISRLEVVCVVQALHAMFCSALIRPADEAA